MIFLFRVDKNHDTVLTLDELEKWIVFKIEEHFNGSLVENKHIFHHMDPENKGMFFCINFGGTYI